MIILLFAALAVFIFLGLPIGLSLAGSSLIYILVSGHIPGLVVIHRMVGGVDSFPLLAVPFFILAGNLMNSTGITERIFGFATAVVGWMRGGLGHVNVGASVLFAGMSGAAVADAGGLGAIEIKAMRDAGYDTDFSIGITASSSTIGPLIPPSLPMVIYGVLASASIGQLFAAGMVPGLLMAAALMVMVAWYARKRGYTPANRFALRLLAHSFSRAFLSLMTPLLIVGGILLGIFTPTEAAIAAVAWALFLGTVVYRNLSWKSFVAVSRESMETTVVILFVVASASIFSWILTENRVPEQFAHMISMTTDNKIAILLLINLILFVVGCFMETVAAITILVPVLLPLAVGVGVDPVQFGVIMVLNLMIGLLTPPVGMVLYVLAKVSNVTFEQSARATMPFLVPLLIVLMLVTFVPQFSMWLPTALYR
ncbi:MULTISPECIES: TRAP transporter large permease [unclassified Thalassospira]|uniref:TRAP transporter large permease n=1 Tax=unclassified Thalassospira TaxID=2648997 RepID=UPI000A1DE754|nr:TRAP transporter large permease [Thalassospira sp. MCCC 1A01428]OSQ45039.1 ABC transporter permease [Thalassospira sp. MCCC 1A01428]